MSIGSSCGPSGAPSGASGSLFAPTGAESRDIDEWAISSVAVPSVALMERAGVHVAQIVARHLGFPPSARAVVVAGGGDNGGDARIAARCLRAWGWSVELLETHRDQRSPVLTRGTLRSVPVSELDDALLTARMAAADVVIDGMLGIGGVGELRGEVLRAARAIGRASEAGRPTVVALDLPSGVDANTGTVVPEAVRADVTVAFGWPKLGSLLHPGRARVGRLLTVEIGFPGLDVDGAPRPTWSALDGAWAARALPVRAPDTHKNAAGAVLVIAGSEGMAGAAVLAGRAALRAGAGYLRLASVASNRSTVQSALPEAVWVDRDDPEALAAASTASSAIVVGPGMGTDESAVTALTAAFAAPIPTVVDADALTLLASGAVAAPSGSAILTPHPGEAGRLLDIDSAVVQADRRSALERLVGRFGPRATVLLKGSPSLIGGTARRLDPTGTSDLATAGMGDVLAGTIGALAAQGTPPEEAAALGLWLTSAAARRAGRGVGLKSEDVPEHLPDAIAEVRAGPSEQIEPWVVCDLPPAR